MNRIACIVCSTMKLIRTALVLGVLAALSAVSQAQSLITIHWLPVFTNYVTNPGFENWYTAWDRSQSYYESDDITYINLGLVTSDSHTGAHGMDTQIGYSGGYGGFYHSDIRQTLATPIAVNSLYDGSIWCQSSFCTVHMVAKYTDNSTSYSSFYVDSYNAAPGDNGFVKWNFLPSLTANKTVKAIDFYADSFEGSDVVFDDVSLTTLRWIYIG